MIDPFNLQISIDYPHPSPDFVRGAFPTRYPLNKIIEYGSCLHRNWSLMQVEGEKTQDNKFVITIESTYMRLTTDTSLFKMLYTFYLI